MPETEVNPLDSPSIDVETTTEIDTIGIEFEYPVEGGGPGQARRSNSLYNEIGYNPWELDDYISTEVPTGDMTSDHVGAEITSDTLNLHSNEPELWYAGTIDRAEEMGYEFAATGHGQTVFGLHLHLSEIPEEKAEALFDMCQEGWMRVFVCSSLSETSCDPWRHGGIGQNHIRGEVNWDGRQYVMNPRGGDGHYEWRLPEPMQMDHFMMVLRFLRILDVEGIEEARDYAEGRVLDRDERLTTVDQYRMMESHVEYDFPNNEMLRDGSSTTPEVAQWFHNFMQGDDGDLLRDY